MTAIPTTFDDVPEPHRQRWLSRTRAILDCHDRLLGTALLTPSGDPVRDARNLYAAPFAVLSHGTQQDPILDYANRTALQLWETTIPVLTALPSRLTAEPLAREAREKLMNEVTRAGYITGYSGVRISAAGKRFRIENVTIFNLTASDGTFAGQAAVFDRWTPL